VVIREELTPSTHTINEADGCPWRKGHISSDWKDRILVTLYKGKGTKSECSSYRPNTLLSIPGKVFAHILLVRIQPLLEVTRRPQHLADLLLTQLSRCAFYPRSIGNSVDNYRMSFLDIKAAFNSVDRRALSGKPSVVNASRASWWISWQP